jgi:hypothetical protein
MITNEMIEGVLEGIQAPTEQSIRGTLNEWLIGEGYPNLHANGIFNPNTNLFEGVIMDGDVSSPKFHFNYDWDTNEFQSLI